jgi:hypothetical protein
MKTRLSFYFSGLALALLISLSVNAQTTAFSYQGSLNTSGTPANGNHDFEFALFDASLGGSQLGSPQTRINVPVANGIFTVSLDFGSQFPGANRFLEIRVRTSGGGSFTPLFPRQQVTSSPYSINAAQLGGVAASQYVVSGAANINAGTQYSIGGSRVLSIEGTANTFVGIGTSGLNTGTENSFFGNQSGQFNTTGSQNSFFGTNAGRQNNTGSGNSFFGREAGRVNGSGSRNSFFGNEAGRSSSSTVDNSFFGNLAGSINQSGSSNAFFGAQAGGGNIIGSGNTFLGAFAGDTNISGDNNTFVGINTDISSSGLDNATAIGAHAFVAQSNSMVLGGIFGVNGATTVTRVGIGTSTPDSVLEITQDSNVSSSMLLTKYDPDTVFDSFKFVGRRARGSEAAPAAVVSGDSLFRIGADGYDGSTFHGFPKADIEFRATENWTTTANGTHMQLSTTPNGGTNSLTRIHIEHNGNVGIGTAEPARRLHVANGSSGATSLSTSDFVIEDSAAAFQHFLTPNDIESGLLFGSPSATIGGGIIFNNAATNNGIQFRAGGNTTRMTLDASGSLGIGTIAPINRLTIGTPETPLLNGAVGIFNAGGTFMTVRDTTNNIEGFVGADSNGVLFGSMSDSIVRIRTGNANRLTFDASGNAVFSGNVIFDAFAVPTVLDTGGTTAICRNASNRLSTCGSSLRYKSNVRDFTSGLNVIKRLRPVSFNWKEGDSRLDLGLVAEEVAAIEPLLTTTNAKGEVEGVKYDRVGVVLVNAVKEQQAQIDAQTELIRRQQLQIEALTKLVCTTNAAAEICKERR